jgi:hypothetical protein
VSVLVRHSLGLNRKTHKEKREKDPVHRLFIIFAVDADPSPSFLCESFYSIQVSDVLTPAGIHRIRNPHNLFLFPEVAQAKASLRHAGSCYSVCFLGGCQSVLGRKHTE